MFNYFRRCLAWTGNNYSDEKCLELLKTIKHRNLIQLQTEQDSTLEEPCYELTDLARLKATGSLRSSPPQPTTLSASQPDSSQADSQEKPSLADMKPPSEENGRWYIVQDAGKIIDDFLKSKGKKPLKKSALRTRRESIAKIQDTETKCWYGKDAEGVFIRQNEGENKPTEYFILCKKDKRFPKGYPMLVD